MQPARVVNLMKRAQAANLLQDLIPANFRVDISTHERATVCQIFLVDDNEPDLMVWFKTNWKSKTLSFADKDKANGLLSDCAFVRDDLIAFFEELRAVVETTERTHINNKETRLRDEQALRRSLVERHRINHMERRRQRSMINARA